MDTRYDELNRSTATIDPLGKTTTTGFDNDDNVISTVDALNQASTISYDVMGRPVALTGPAGGHETVKYDAGGNPIQTTNAVGGVATATYDADGRMITTVDPRGNVAGANPADYTTTFGYDADSNPVSATDALGGTTRTTFDGAGRTTGVTDADGHTTSYRYDDADRVTAIVGPDAPGQPGTGTSVPLHPVASTYAYDPAGQIVARADPYGHTTGYSYDAVGRLSATTDPLDRQTTYAYDAEGNLVRSVAPGAGDPAPRSIVTTYDLLNRRVGQDMGHGGTIYAWGYDAKNRLTSLADPAGLRTQTYDDADRLTGTSRGGRLSFGYGYDSDGNVTSRTWPDGTTISSTFDAADELTGLTAQGGGAGAQPVAYTFGYDPAGRPTTTRYPSSGGLTTDRTYDRAGRLVDLNSHDATGTLARFQLTLDPVGNPTTITTTRGGNSQRLDYAYDPAGRVTAACVGGCAAPTGTARYSYDLVGNRRTQTLSGSSGDGTTAYGYDSADELTGTVAKDAHGTTKVDYGYDGMGNQTRSGNDTFTYNLDHTMASATVGGVRTSYTYDAQGLQLSAVSNVANGPRSRSWATDVNAPLPHLAVETTATPTGSTSRDFLTGAQGTPLALLTQGRADSYLPDWLTGVADVVSTQDQPLAAYDQDPYGNPRGDGTAAGIPPVVDNPIRFAGQYLDGTLGSWYTAPARAYDPGTGRFDGTDPAMSVSTGAATSAYAYVADRPTVLIDPSGADPCSTGGDGCSVYDPSRGTYTPCVPSASQPCEMFGKAVKPGPRCFNGYCVGPPVNPTHFGPADDDFKYDPNAKPTLKDYESRTEWLGRLAGCATLAFWHLNSRCVGLADALNTYNWYWYGNGKDYTVDLERGYAADANIRQDVNNEISRAEVAAEGIHATFYLSTFSMTGKAHGESFYPNTEDWQKTLGDYQIWGSADVTVDGNKAAMKVTVHSEDRYNFNKGAADIATGAPDAVNGRFATLGWAKGFNTHGQLAREVTWVVGQASAAVVTKPSSR